MSRQPIPIPHDLTLEMSAAVAASGGRAIVADESGFPAGAWVIERAFRADRVQVDGLPDGSGSMT